jgi:hypothetical protein
LKSTGTTRGGMSAVAPKWDLPDTPEALCSCRLPVPGGGVLASCGRGVHIPSLRSESRSAKTCASGYSRSPTADWVAVKHLPLPDAGQGAAGAGDLERNLVMTRVGVRPALLRGIAQALCLC